MIEFIQKIWVSLICFLQNFQDFLSPFLQRLDPALFQNIILGVLAIFIPFAIVFLTDILNSKKEKRSEFEKMVLSDEVLGTKKVFWLSIFGVVFFAFFSGVDTSTPAKLVTIIAAIILTFLFWKPFKKILRFSEGYKPEFEILFLKKLSFSKICNFKNKSKAEKILRSWNSFWSERSKINERDFTNIFISHIDDAIKFKKFDLAVQLAQVYANNIEKRDRFSIGYEILPKVFEWNEIFWKEQQLWLNARDTEKRIQAFFSQKHFPTFRDWALKIYKKLNSESERFWNWHYFGEDFFQAIIKTLLKDRHDPYQLFTSFKKYVEESEKKLEKITDEKEKEKYRYYVTGLFSSFCPTFFNEIDSAPSNYGIWEHNFPLEWKVIITNKDSRIARVILYEFLRWSEDRVYKERGGESLDEKLTEVINGIFPKVHSSLFTSFLMLFFHGVRSAIEKEPNFYISGVSVSWSGSVEESEEDMNKRLDEMMRVETEFRKKETIDIILNFFPQYWDKLKITLDDNNKDKWEKADSEKKESMLKTARKEKLKKIKVEVESEEIKNICKGSEIKELYRKYFLELIELLILEIEK